MTPAQAIELIHQRWRDQWDAMHPTVSYALDNELFRGSTPTWVRVHVTGGRSEQRSMGPVGRRRFEHFGTIAVQIFGEADQGRGPVDALCGSARAVLQSLELRAGGDPLWTRAAELQSVAQRDNWWTALVVVPFSYFALE